MSPIRHQEIQGREADVLTWASELDDGTLTQAARSSRLPFVAGPVALMPDAHVGLGATVGSVIPTKGAIIPAAVGVDIGCGMIAAELDLTSDALGDNLDDLHRRISQVVPAGVGKGHGSRRRGGGRRGSPSSATAADPATGAARTSRHWPAGAPSTELSDRQEQKTYDQFGTLGSGNHFVEVCLDERDVVWIVLHSGSRGIGNQLAQRHIEGARGLMARYHVELEDRDLAYLVEGTDEFDAYISDMLWAQDYAAGNRAAMLDAVLAAVTDWLDASEPVPVTSRINCHHNYTEKEVHGGEQVWLTRKGAIRARAGDRGVIPGSMGTSSFIVRGLGNPASYQSSAHGAGRRMSRSAARRRLDPQGLERAMEGKAWNRNAQALLDEDPRSYKDVDQVMRDQADLVEIEHTLTQILNYKGT